MKKFLTLFLAALMAFSCIAAQGAAEQAVPSAKNTLTVGSTTGFSGDFFSDMWGSNTSDMDVRMLLEGYGLIRWNVENGAYEEDKTVVRDVLITENAVGDRTYDILLNRNLKYSDGSPVTAWDYAFSILLSVAPEIAEIGGDNNGSNYIYGVEAYKNGNSDVLTGVHVYANDRIAITVSRDYVPFFYELGLLNYAPYPISVIAPGCKVADNGKGVYIANIDEKVEEPVFTAELLAETILNPETGYLSHPSVVSGPYKLVSYDGQTAEFEINENYKGNYAGVKPSIEHITFKTVSNETVMAQLESGEIDLVNKCVASDTVAGGISLASATDKQFSMANYARSGYSFISFNCEKATVADAAVRQAIAYCFDKDAAVREYVGNYGIRADGYYGIGQWMVQVVNGTVAAPAQPDENGEMVLDEEAWEALSLDNVTTYGLDLNAAVKSLQGDGWTLNREGGAFDASKDDVRCKMIENEIVALDLKLVYPEGNAIGEVLQTTLVDNLASVGVKLTLEAKPMNELLSMYYRQTERDCDMFYLATNFNAVFEPSETFNPEDAYQGVHNRTAIADEELYRLAVNMRKTEAGDALGYCQKWVAFQERFAKVLPTIPVYSGVYFDFYTDALKNYNVSANVSWAQAIVGAYLQEN